MASNDPSKTPAGPSPEFNTKLALHSKHHSKLFNTTKVCNTDSSISIWIFTHLKYLHNIYHVNCEKPLLPSGNRLFYCNCYDLYRSRPILI